MRGRRWDSGNIVGMCFMMSSSCLRLGIGRVHGGSGRFHSVTGGLISASLGCIVHDRRTLLLMRGWSTAIAIK